MVNKWHIVANTVTDMWLRPKFESGRVSQAVCGQILREVRHKAGFSYCYSEDNYAGWVRKSHLINLPQDIGKLRCAHIKTYLADIFSLSSARTCHSRLSYGSAVFCDKIAGNMIHLKYPDGWARKSDVIFRKKSLTSFNVILKDLKKFLGTPYLWGGKSAFGIDCSGLVQLVYNFHGYDLPRDSRDQAEFGRRVARKNILPGDLIFSPGHVCIHLGHETILHANAQNGLVNIESLDKQSSQYRADIAENITMIRRVL